MKRFSSYVGKNPLAVLLLALPLALISQLGSWPAIWVFLLAALGVVPLAGYIGEATEVLSAYTGPRIGGLLNATLGNAAELIITLVAIQAGLLELVKASITGSILGNILFVMGVAMFTGGLKHSVQTFDRRHSSNQAILLILAVLALVIPSIFSHSIGEEGSQGVETLSLGVALIMLIIYVGGLMYSLKSRENPLSHPSEIQKKNHGSRQIVQALIILALSTGGVIWLSELLVGTIETVVVGFGLSEFFLGIILVPIIGNIAEHLVAVRVAWRNQMDLSVEIAVSSSLQIALFVAPLLVFISLLMGNPLTIIFHPFELAALGAGVLVTAFVASDGESNWLEGAALIGLYLILGFAFFLLPA